MIESTKSKVTFLPTNSISTRSQQNVSLSRSLSQSEIQLYRDLTDVSDGQTIDITNTTSSQATAVITDLITADLNVTFFLFVTGRDSVTVTEVLLVEASGSDFVNGTVKAVGATDFLVNIDRIPEWAFVVQLKGLLNDSSSVSRFQRQSPTQHKGSRITVMAQSQNITQPGVPLSLNFTVATNTTGGTYTIRALNDQGFSVSFPSSLILETGGSAQGSVTLTAPSDTESGTDVKLTIEAEDLGSTSTGK
ncbi:uncharacterized protein LOC127958778 [Carassius gibelio]|uniref:uncharacterized protein LOC127958778 n=1 Tax=Carassius gibelio TaxID=101364 RepID=UPI0022790D14|nr:uncharacterized protein LOC127958778 [Carassius gibelio]